MRRRWIVAFVALLGLPILLTAAALAIFVSLSSGQHQAFATLVLGILLDAPVAFEGPFSFEVSWEPTLVARDIRIGNGVALLESDSPIDGRIGSIDLELDLNQIWSGKLVVREMTIKAVDIASTPRPIDWHALWRAFIGPLEEGLWLFVDSAILQDVRFVRRAVEGGPPQVIEVKHFSADEVDKAGHFFLSGDLSINGSPLTIQGDLDFLSGYWDLEKPAPLNFSVVHPTFEVTFVGETFYEADAPNWDLTVDLEVFDIRALGEVLGEPAWPAGSLLAFSHLLADQETTHAEDLLVEFKDAEGRSLRITGTVEDLRKPRGAALELAGRLPQADALLQPFVDRPLPELAGVFIDARLTAEEEVWRSEIDQVLVDGAEDWSLAASGAAAFEAQKDSLRKRDLAVAWVLTGAETATVVGLAGPQIPDLGPLEAEGELKGDEKGLFIEDLSLELGRAETLKVTGEGRVELPELGETGEFPRLDVDLVVGARRAKATAELFGFRIPLKELGPLSGRVELQGGGDAPYRLEGIDASIGSDPALHYNAAGGVGAIFFDAGRVRVQEIDLLTEVEGPVEELAAKLGLPWPDPGKIRFVNHISGDDEELRFRPREYVTELGSGFVTTLGKVDDESGFTLSLSDGLRVKDLRLPLKSSAPKAAAFNVWLKRPLIPALGEVSGTAVMVLVDGKIAMREIEYTIGPKERPRVTVAAQVDDLLRLEKMTVAADFATDLDTIFDPFTNAELEPLGRVKGRVEISDVDGTLGIEKFEMASAEDNELRLSVSGIIDDLKRATDADLSIDLRIPRLSIIQKIVRPDLEHGRDNVFFAQPVGLAGRFLAQDFKNFASFEGVGRLGEGEVIIDLRMHDLATKPDIKGSFAVSELNLKDFGIELLHRDPNRPKRESQWLFPDKEFFVLPLEGASLDLTVTIPEVSDPIMTLNRIDARFIWSEEVFAVRPLAFAYAGGRGSIELNVDFTEADIRRHVTAKAADMELANILSRFGDGPPAAQGRFTVNADITMRGNSPRALASSVNGRVGITLEAGRLNQGNLRMLSPDTLHWLVGAFGESYTDLDCVVARFDVNEGVAKSETLLIAAPKVKLTGEGTIDLRKEELDVAFVAEKPDYAPPGLSKPFGFRGRLARPEVHFSVSSHLADLALLPVFLPWHAAGYLASKIAEDAESPCIGLLQEQRGDG